MNQVEKKELRNEDERESCEQIGRVFQLLTGIMIYPEELNFWEMKNLRWVEIVVPPIRKHFENEQEVSLVIEEVLKMKLEVKR